MASAWQGWGAAAVAALCLSAHGGVRGQDAETLQSPIDKDPCDLRMAPHLGWLQSYLKVGFFTDFRMRSWIFFLQNETSYAWLWLNSIAYANMDFVKETCPEAARLAFLIRAEERLPTRESEDALLEYAVLSAANRGGVDDTLWPTDYAVHRLKLMAAALSTPEEYSVDVVMPYCNEPLDGLLSKAVGYEEEWLSTTVPMRHARLLLYRLEDCFPAGVTSEGRAATGSAALSMLPERAATAAAKFMTVEVIPVNASPKAWEAARYLLHLSSRYHNLADFTIFLHPDVFEHVNPRTLRNVMQALRLGTFRLSGLTAPGGEAWYGHVSLSHHYLTRPSRVHSPSSNCTDAELGFKDLWASLFGSDELTRPSQADPTIGHFGFYCCSQFMVHKSRVHKRAQEWYHRVAAEIPWEHCATSYMELLWHAIFNNGTLHEKKRQDRPELPLFLRVDNFIEGTADGLV